MVVHVLHGLNSSIVRGVGHVPLEAPATTDDDARGIDTHFGGRLCSPLLAAAHAHTLALREMKEARRLQREGIAPAPPAERCA